MNICLDSKFVHEFQSMKCMKWFWVDGKQTSLNVLIIIPAHLLRVVTKKMCIDSISSFEMYANIDATEVNKCNRFKSNYVSQVIDSHFISKRLRKKLSHLRLQENGRILRSQLQHQIEPCKLRAWHFPFSCSNRRCAASFSFLRCNKKMNMEWNNVISIASIYWTQILKMDCEFQFELRYSDKTLCKHNWNTIAKSVCVIVLYVNSWKMMISYLEMVSLKSGKTKHVFHV